MTVLRVEIAATDANSRIGGVGQSETVRHSITTDDARRHHVDEELVVTAGLRPARRVVADVVDATSVPTARDSI